MLHQSSPLLVAAHTDSLAAVLECLAVVLRRLAAAVAATGDASVVARGEAIEATGLSLCRYGVGSGALSGVGCGVVLSALAVCGTEAPLVM